MVLEPKALTLPTNSTSSAPRAGVGHRVSSTSQAQVEEATPSSNINFDTSPSGFYDPQSQLNRDRGRQQQPEPNFSRLFYTDSEAFVALFETPPDKLKCSYSSFSINKKINSARAVDIYESNYHLMTENPPLRGTSVSLVL